MFCPSLELMVLEVSKLYTSLLDEIPKASLHSLPMVNKGYVGDRGSSQSALLDMVGDFLSL